MSIRLLGPVSVADADGRELLPAGPDAAIERGRSTPRDCPPRP
jgi:hypothetical protein